MPLSDPRTTQSSLSPTLSATSSPPTTSPQPPAWLTTLSSPPNLFQMILNLTTLQFQTAVSLASQYQLKTYLYVHDSSLFPPDSYRFAAEKFVYLLHNNALLVLLPLLSSFPPSSNIVTLYHPDHHDSIHADDHGLYISAPLH